MSQADLSLFVRSHHRFTLVKIELKRCFEQQRRQVEQSKDTWSWFSGLYKCTDLLVCYYLKLQPRLELICISLLIVRPQTTQLPLLMRDQAESKARIAEKAAMLVLEEAIEDFFLTVGDSDYRFPKSRLIEKYSRSASNISVNDVMMVGNIIVSLIN